MKMKNEEFKNEDIACSFQKKVIEILTDKVMMEKVHNGFEGEKYENVKERMVELGVDHFVHDFTEMKFEWL